ncbi:MULTISPECIES: DUF202 domain-containing protein [unclassified Streptomyces]|uniref:DUF202 domain-containing protein n=1 Tax=unclassified Streptomyces TaxID=2593676 RepID=UPI002AA2A36D|nr:DUF202 domain-containing protein [Streptomyces sp. SHP 1-2]
MTRDPGLQPERTRLAWRRTTLSATVTAVLAARTALGRGAGPVQAVAVALCAALWLGFLYIAQRRTQGLAGSPSPGPLPPTRAAAAVLCIAALAGCGAVLIL